MLFTGSVPLFLGMDARINSDQYAQMFGFERGVEEVDLQVIVNELQLFHFGEGDAEDGSEVIVQELVHLVDPEACKSYGKDNRAATGCGAQLTKAQEQATSNDQYGADQDPRKLASLLFW